MCGFESKLLAVVRTFKYNIQKITRKYDFVFHLEDVSTDFCKGFSQSAGGRRLKESLVHLCYCDGVAVFIGPIPKTYQLLPSNWHAFLEKFAGLVKTVLQLLRLVE